MRLTSNWHSHMTNPFWKESDSAAWIKEGRQKLYYVDVPVGWKYGFPKAIPNNGVDSVSDIYEWVVANGYPKEEMDRMGSSFYIRMWTYLVPESKSP